MAAVPDLAAIFKAYDVRGLVPEQLDDATARSIGAAFAAETVGSDPTPAGPPARAAVVVGHDMRPTSPGLAASFAEGVRDCGVDVVRIGLASTDELYFASGSFGLPGAMFTASHNPGRYNGVKLCRASAVAIAADTGLDAIRRRVQTGDLPRAAERGAVEDRDVLGAYAAHLRRLAPVTGRRLTVAVDAGNGMAGHTVPAVFAGLPVDVVPLYFELDGTFPHHEANPLDPRNLVDLQEAVRGSGADLGLAFDGDADRCFAVDERGELISPSALTALIAVRELRREPGARIIHNLITSSAVPELVTASGGVPIRTRVGHSFIKATMAEQDAIFGGEHSGHFYFRDFWFADSGLLAALHLLAALAETETPVSALLAGLDPYAASGEINRHLGVGAEPAAVLDAAAEAFGKADGVRLDRLDGLTVVGEDGWFNLRPSNTEPVLRLNVEAATQAGMIELRDRVLRFLDDVTRSATRRRDE